MVLHLVILRIKSAIHLLRDLICLVAGIFRGEVKDVYGDWGSFDEIKIWY